MVSRASACGAPPPLAGARSFVLKLNIGSAGSPELAAHWQGLLAPGRQLHAAMLTSVVPQMREFSALCTLASAPQPLVAQLLAPLAPAAPQPPAAAPAPPPAASGASAAVPAALAAGPLGQAQLAPALLEALAGAYNGTQQAAIAACLEPRQWPWVLVQGEWAAPLAGARACWTAGRPPDECMVVRCSGWDQELGSRAGLVLLPGGWHRQAPPWWRGRG